MWFLKKDLRLVFSNFCNKNSVASKFFIYENYKRIILMWQKIFLQLYSMQHTIFIELYSIRQKICIKLYSMQQKISIELFPM